MRQIILSICLICLLPNLVQAQSDLEQQFEQWLQDELWPKARAQGISNRGFQNAMQNVQLDLTLPGLVLPGQSQTKQTITQAEFRAPIRYFREQNLRLLTRRGGQILSKNRAILQKIERNYGVPPGILLAIWGRESAYGGASIPNNAISVLATRAFLSDRKDYFRDELLAAIQIIENGDVPLEQMNSSWAGALGSPQFMPSSYLNFAVDFDGDGKRNIWTSVPDILASIANYLQKNGWQPKRDWGYEVRMPEGANCAREGPDRAKALSLWADDGITRVSGRPFPGAERNQAGMLILPAGLLGPQFIVTPNFYVIKRYNNSDNYALFIGNLADRIIYGMGAFLTPWQQIDVMYRSDIRKIQQYLISLGYDVGGADGLPGYKTRRSIGDWQAKNALQQTCFPSNELLERIK